MKIVLIGILIVAGCASKPGTSDGSSSVTAPAPNSARVCTVRGRGATAGVSEPRAIIVSSEGGWCSHMRQLGKNNQLYEISTPPQHGEVSQQALGADTRVSYRPSKGYVGNDAFTLRYSERNMELPYVVSVIP